MNSSDDELVEQYLARLYAAAGGMPADRRLDLIDEISAHIAEARAADPGQPGGVRAVLDQLGSPEDIVRAAGTSADAPPPSRADGMGALEIAAVIALLVGGIVIPVIGWVVGVVLLWMSPVWRTRDKLLATLVWPGGLAAAIFALFVVGAGALFTTQACTSVGSTTHCTPAPIPPWLAIALAVVVLIASVAGPILVTIRLLRQARNRGALAAGADPDLLTPSLSAG